MGDLILVLTPLFDVDEFKIQVVPIVPDDMLFFYGVFWLFRKTEPLLRVLSTFSNSLSENLMLLCFSNCDFRLVINSVSFWICTSA